MWGTRTSGSTSGNKNTERLPQAQAAAPSPNATLRRDLIRSRHVRLLSCREVSAVQRHPTCLVQVRLACQSYTCPFGAGWTSPGNVAVGP
jgi:hypothetical protein